MSWALCWMVWRQSWKGSIDAVLRSLTIITCQIHVHRWPIIRNCVGRVSTHAVPFAWKVLPLFLQPTNLNHLLRCSSNPLPPRKLSQNLMLIALLFSRLCQNDRSSLCKKAQSWAFLKSKFQIGFESFTESDLPSHLQEHIYYAKQNSDWASREITQKQRFFLLFREWGNPAVWIIFANSERCCICLINAGTCGGREQGECELTGLQHRAPHVALSFSWPSMAKDTAWIDVL